MSAAGKVDKRKRLQKVFDLFEASESFNGFTYHFTGIVNQKLDPSPFFDSTPICPPNSSTIPLHI